MTYLPLLIAARATLPSLTEPYGQVLLPFLRDWNVMFMFLVTMPALVAYLVNDQRVLTTALGRTVREEILELSVADADHIVRGMEEVILRWVNLSAQVIGATIGVAVASMNYRVYSPARVGYWTMNGDHLTGAGVRVSLGRVPVF